MTNKVHNYERYQGRSGTIWVKSSSNTTTRAVVLNPDLPGEAYRRYFRFARPLHDCLDLQNDILIWQFSTYSCAIFPVIFPMQKEIGQSTMKYETANEHGLLRHSFRL